MQEIIGTLAAAHPRTALAETAAQTANQLILELKGSSIGYSTHLSPPGVEAGVSSESPQAWTAWAWRHFLLPVVVSAGVLLLCVGCVRYYMVAKSGGRSVAGGERPKSSYDYGSLVVADVDDTNDHAPTLAHIGDTPLSPSASSSSKLDTGGRAAGLRIVKISPSLV